MDVLAWNRLAAALISDFGAVPERHRNFVRISFTDPAMRSLYAEWNQDARLCVAQLHMELARDPRDPRLAELVDELSMLDADFRCWWSDYQVAARSQGTKRFRHPIIGDLTLHWDVLSCAGDPDQQFVL